MNVAIARPTDARANTAFEGELRCYERLAGEDDLNITVIAREGHSLRTDAVEVVTCAQTIPEWFRHQVRQGWKRLRRRNRVVMPEFSAISDVLRRGDYDVVETADPTLYPGAYATYTACRKTETPIVPRASATKHLPNVVPRAETRAVVDYASGFQFVSPMTHNRYVERGYLDDSDDRVRYTGHPVDVDLFTVESNGSNEGPVTVLSVGVLEERKGYRVLCEAIRRLREDGVSVRWDVVGTGPLEDWMRSFVRTHDLSETVTLHGQIPHERINRAYAAADVFALHSMETATWEEYFGVAYAEAMSSGLPVIGSDSGAIPWVVRDGTDGILAPEGSVDAVEDALRTLVADPDRREEMGRNGRRNVEDRFHIDSVARTFRKGWRAAVADC